ncbi:MAG TPA: hypothetical protein VG125_14485, partial [Pirellulales bacterium]|nr:hypothetical protein [Pirellulales bacterium]
MSDLTTRERLIQRLFTLPADDLPRIEQFFDSLEPVTKEPAPIAQRPGSSPTLLNTPRAPRDWPHAPLHRLGEHGTYLVTAGTLQKEHFFRGSHRLDLMEASLLTKAKAAGWQLEAWAVFSNHYHFVAHALSGCEPLRSMLKSLHGETAVALNRMDAQQGRRVRFNFRETELTYEKSYHARLNYVHHNAVKHGLVRVANQYPWCSAAWFERTATPAQGRTIYSFRGDKV